MSRPTVLSIFDYQNAWSDDFSQFKIIDKTRQAGITFIETLSIIQRLLRRRDRWYYLSVSEARSAEALQYAVAHCMVMGLALSHNALVSSFFEDTKFQQLTLTLPNGSKLIGLPANPRTARGIVGNLTLDEYAHHLNAKEIWKGVAPAATWGYSIHVISTPNGRQGDYYDIWTHNGEHEPERIEAELKAGRDPCSDNWSRHFVDVYRAIADGHPITEAKARELARTEDIFQQEYCGKFLDEAAQWIPFELLERCTRRDIDASLDLSQRPAGPVHGGMDIGRKRDLTVIWLNEQRGAVQWPVGLIRLRKARWKAQEQALDSVMPLARRMCIDETGIGHHLAESAQEKWGESVVEPVSFAGKTPALLASLVRQHLEQETQVLPDDEQIRRDFRAIRRVYTDAGAVRFEAPRTKDGHADHFWACGLALRAAGEAVPPVPPGAGTGPDSRYGHRPRARQGITY